MDSGEPARREFILLIGKFVHRHPVVPFVWIITSHPEPHLKTAFLLEPVKASCLEIEVPFDTDQACWDLELYLRQEIKEKFPLSFPPTQQYWPMESHIMKVANRAQGLFVATVIQFIDDEDYGNPVAQLDEVLDVVDGIPVSESQSNPFATLDALHTEILSSIPQETYVMTKRILISHAYGILGWLSRLLHVSNWLGLTQVDAYGALRKLHPVLYIPLAEVSCGPILPFHSSFGEYLISPSRSGHFA